MNIAKRIMNLSVICLLLFSSLLIFENDVVEAEDYIGGPITGTLDNSDIHVVTSDLSVPPGGILNITSGTYLQFQSLLSFKIFGTLRCLGTANDPVRISFYGTQAPGSWEGIIIDGGSAVFNYTVIQSAATAVKVMNGVNPSFNYCTFRDSEEGVVVEGSSWPRLYNCTIKDSTLGDIALDQTSQLNFTESSILQTSPKPTLTSIKVKSNSRLKLTNSTIEDKYKFNIELNSGGYANLLNSNFSMARSKFKFNDPDSIVIIKNFLDIFVGTKTKTGEVPLPGSKVNIFDDTIKVNTKHGATNSNGYMQWIELTHMEYSRAQINDNVTSIEIDYGTIFTPGAANENMSTTHEAKFVNNIPQFNLLDEYEIEEDTRNLQLIDLYKAVSDDYDENETLEFNIIKNTGENITGKEIAAVQIDNSGRYVSVDVESGSDNDNWTGPFEIQINASDRLGRAYGLNNTSTNITIKVTPVNDPPVWIDVGVLRLDEDTDLLNAMNVRDKIEDSDTAVEAIQFSVKDYDKTNYLVDIDTTNQLNIRILNENHTDSSNVTLCAFDTEDWGNYTTKIEIIPQNDAPAVNFSLQKVEMFEDTVDSTTIDLQKVFYDAESDTLAYHTLGNKYVGVDIDQNSGMVTLEPEQDWFGEEIITFYANDSYSETGHSILIKVKGVNDPPRAPVIIHPGETEQREYKAKEQILFSAEAYDPDIHNPDIDPSFIIDNLQWVWRLNTSSDSTPFNIFNNFTKAINDEGYHRITVKVTDMDGKENSTYFDIFIFGQFNPPEVTHIKPLPFSYSSINNVRLEWDVNVDSEALKYVRYDVLLDEANPPSQVVAGKIQNTFFTAKDLRDGAKYFWSIVPYISTDVGVDISGVWEFTYQSDIVQVFDLSLSIDPQNFTIYPGDNKTVQITVTNLGNMPDIYEISIDVDKLIEEYVWLNITILEGWSDGIYGMKSNEKETVTLYISLPRDFKLDGLFEISVIVTSTFADEERVKDVNPDVLERPEGKPPSPLDIEEGLGIYIVSLLIVVIIVIVILFLAFYFKRKKEEEAEIEKEDEDEREDKQISPPAIPQPVLKPKAAAPQIPLHVSEEKKPESKESETPTAVAPEPQNVQNQVLCGSCGSEIPLTSTERPLEVNCDSCGNQFTVK